MQTQEAPDFTRVDQTADPASCVQYLDTWKTSAMASLQQMRRQSVALLGLREGDRVLEVGCGTGEDTQALAAIVGTTGRAVGVDSSETMIAEARSRARECGLPVEFQVGDAHRLEFADDTFDAVRVERTFMHLDDPGRALCELIRVVRPGGRVLIGEPDWETLVLDVPDRPLTRKILNFGCDTYRHGWIGRQLPGYLRAHGLAEITVLPATMILTDLALASQIFMLRAAAEQAQAAGVIESDEAERWLDHLEAAGQAGNFFAAVTGFVVGGRKP
jgi:ubiquinone/menaquinone biosynthesis C-methylase UbiE